MIPIRPTKKHLFPEMTMTAYMHKKKDNKIFDPWLRTHVKAGAQIIKVCEKSMSVKGDLSFWEALMKRKLITSGAYKLEGALSLIVIDIENDHGEYLEPNIWIGYGL